MAKLPVDRTRMRPRQNLSPGKYDNKSCSCRKVISLYVQTVRGGYTGIEIAEAVDIDGKTPSRQNSDEAKTEFVSR